MAPSARAVHKAEAKYGVTADYPDLQLHSAAANGNVGLVKYALMHGQPVNSVLNGVLPIHIAAASGSEMVVQMLIDAGADVNAARLPRKYNADRAKAGISIGAAGSTPLHFAAANGHANVVSLLLTNNANPNLAEKHGLTPEDLARQSGHVNVLTVFRLWRQSEQEQQQQHQRQLVASGSGVSGSSNGGYRARDNSDNASIAASIASSRASARTSPTKRLASSGASIIRDLRSAAAAANSASSAGAGTKKLLGKPSLDSLASGGKGKRSASGGSAGRALTGLIGHPSRDNVSIMSASPSSLSIPQFPAPAPLTLRQNPSTSAANMHRQTTSPTATATTSTASSTGPPLLHIINTDKARRPSLPSVFEKAAHSSASIKSALGMTPAHPHQGMSLSSKARSMSSSSQQSDRHPGDPYHLGRPKRSGSKTSLSSMFRHATHAGRDRAALSGLNMESMSQPLSPAASSFFTCDDELEQAEREAFLRGTPGENPTSSGDETYQQYHIQQQYGRMQQQQQQQPPYPRTYIGSDTSRQRRNSTEGLQTQQHPGNGRSRAGSGSSAATSTSASASASGRTGYYSSSLRASSAGGTPGGGAHSGSPYPMTAPPTQSGFFQQQRTGSSQHSPSDEVPALPRSESRGTLSPTLVIPAPIPPPPSSSTQPFFTKAAIAAAHNNVPVSRPGFYRPRKSSQLSNPASTVSMTALSSPDLGHHSASPVPDQHLAARHIVHRHPADFDLFSDGEAGVEGGEASGQLSPPQYHHHHQQQQQPPAVIVRRPTVRALASPSDASSTRSRTPSSPPSIAVGESATSPVKSSPLAPSPPRASSSSSSSAAAAAASGTRSADGGVPGNITTSATNRHSRSSSDGTGTLRSALHPGSSLPDVEESPTSDMRQRSFSHGPLPSPTVHAQHEERQLGSEGLQPIEQAQGQEQEQEIDPEAARESEDTFPVDQERPFPTRSRAGSRARVDSSSSGSSSMHHQPSQPASTAGTGQGHHQPSPNMPSLAHFAQAYQNVHYHPSTAGTGVHPDHHDTSSSSWHLMTRPSRSGSTGTDTRTSRSGSLGEGHGPPPRFFGFDYSSSPASTSSFNYQPSHSTTATSLVSSPPGSSTSTAHTPSAPPSDGGVGGGSQITRTVTHEQAKSLVKRREEELLSYDPSIPPSSDSGYSNSSRGGYRRLSLSQQLAAYGESLSIERQLLDAERNRKNTDQPATLTISAEQHHNSAHNHHQQHHHQHHHHQQQGGSGGVGANAAGGAKYSWEILGKESRTTVPLTAGQRAKDKEAIKPAHQPLWTHKMVSPFEVPLPRPGGNPPGHKHTSSVGTSSTITSSGKPLTRVLSNETSPPSKFSPPPVIHETTATPPAAANSNNISTQVQTSPSVRDPVYRSRQSPLVPSTSYLSPIMAGGSDVSATRRSPRLRSSSPSRKSPRSSLEKDRPAVPGATSSSATSYHVVAAGPPGFPHASASTSANSTMTGGDGRPGSEPTDSANSSLVSEPRSMRSIRSNSSSNAAMSSSYASNGTATPFNTYTSSSISRYRAGGRSDGVGNTSLTSALGTTGLKSQPTSPDTSVVSAPKAPFSSSSGYTLTNISSTAGNSLFGTNSSNGNSSSTTTSGAPPPSSAGATTGSSSTATLTGSNLAASSSAAGSPSTHHNSNAEEATPRPQPHQALRLETTMAPKFRVETKAGGEFAPSPTKNKFATKLGKFFR